MTDKQVEKAKAKIKKIRATLAAEKRKIGCYDDSRGLRYLPTELYIKLADYSGGLTYLKWFDKNFPDDSGFPNFLFEWTVLLYKTGDILGAEKKALQTFFSNSYIFDKFFNRPYQKVDKYENSNWENSSLADELEYSKNQPDLLDFTNWLDNYLATEKFKTASDKFIDINKRLKNEQDQETRTYLFRHLRQIVDEP